MPSDQSIHWVNKYFQKMLPPTQEHHSVYVCNICLYETGNVSGMRHHVRVTHGEYQDKLFSSLMNTEDESSQNRKIKK